ncbi:MAG: hypothetical protein ACPGJV_02740 [Bacteriovoracaceae bacterium]
MTLIKFHIGKISGVTPFEQAHIIATILAHKFGERFNCSLCKKKYSKSEQIWEIQKKRKGCVIPLENGELVNSGGLQFEFKKCAGNFYSFGVQHLVDLYHKYQKNIFAYEGTYLEQPAKYIELMEYIGKELGEGQ